MLTYSFSASEGIPLYIALYRSIRADILAGKLAPDERLPSKRSLPLGTWPVAHSCLLSVA